MQTLTSRVSARISAQPGAVVIQDGAQAIVAEALWKNVEGLSARLASAGVQRGTAVALAMPNGAEFARAFLAIVRLGGIVAPLNPAFKATEMAAVLADCRPVVALANEVLFPEVARAAEAVSIHEDRVLRLPEATETRGSADAALPDYAQPSDVAVMLYSSGSTGRPKRIERTHAQLIFETDRLIKAIGLTSDDRVLGVAPFSHINGMMRSMVASLVGGATLVPLPQYERRLVAQTIEAQRITVFIGVPFMFAVLADTRWPKPVDFSSLRLCVSASAPLRPEASRRFHARYGLYVRQLYGCSETGSISVNLDADPADSLESVGKPLEGIEIDVFTEDRRILPPGEEGEIGIRSPAAINQYPDRPEENAAAFWGGCFFPGDIGRKDEDGRLYLLGRKSLFINRGGFKVNPYELEALLEKHPKVAEVAVVGIPAEHGDERIKAVVIPSASCDEQEIVEFCRGKIADFKIPSVIEFRAELPKSSSGKVLRKQLL